MSDRQFDLVVRGGTLVTAEGRRRTDIGIREGRVVRLEEGLSGTQEIDATGQIVLPGGVDPHVHLHVEDVDPADPSWVDDYTSGSQAALAGGVTSLGNMSYVLPWETIAERVRRESAAVAEMAIADVFFHTVVFSPGAEMVAEIPRAVAAGQSSMKIFMCLPSFEAFASEFTRVIKGTGDAGGITLIHCEDLATIECCTTMLREHRHTDLSHFAESRPIASEVIATERAIEMCRATGAPIYIVHLSSARALAACAEARAAGLPVFVETRPLYLYLSAERYREPEGGLYVAQPPLREAADQDALWRGLAVGDIDTLASDHAPWTRDLKLDPKLDVVRARPGVAELDTMLPLLYTEGVLTGRISLERFVALTSTNAARLFGLYPRKGTIAVGSDADLVVWKTPTSTTPELDLPPSDRRIIRDADLFTKAGHSVYAGRELRAWPLTTVRRGEIVFDHGRVIGRPGSGRPISRAGTMAPLPTPR